LKSYIANAEIMFCPSAPEKYEFLQEAWEAEDEWDHPETTTGGDSMIGSYCLYWNYIGYMEEGGPFKGPRTPLGGRSNSKILLTDYFGFNHWRSPYSVGSCEKLRNSVVTPGTWVSSAYWSHSWTKDGSNIDMIKVRLHAGYIDGHVSSYICRKKACVKACDGV
jgi:hypothetical protein